MEQIPKNIIATPRTNAIERIVAPGFAKQNVPANIKTNPDSNVNILISSPPLLC